MASGLILNAFVQVPGHHSAAWRHPTSTAEQTRDLDTFASIARTAERGVLRSVFIADSPGGGRDVAGWNGGLEPLTLLSALAAVTDHIGLIGTPTTTFTDPYSLARAFASLDQISRGRAGWNIVTSANVEAVANFSTEPLSHEARYPRHRVRRGGDWSVGGTVKLRRR